MALSSVGQVEQGAVMSRGAWLDHIHGDEGGGSASNLPLEFWLIFGGMFLWAKQSGQPVKQGEPLGRINDPFGKEKDVYIVSPHDGHIIGHNNTPVISPGDALFHIAYEKD